MLTEDRWAGRISAGEFPAPVEPLARVRVPKHFNHRSPQERRDLAADAAQRAATRRASPRPGARRPRPARTTSWLALRARAAPAPVPRCADREEHARWAERRARLERDTDALRDRVANRTGSLARTFDRVCALLDRRAATCERRTDGHRRRPACWPGSGPSPTCWSPSACAAGCGTGWTAAELAAAVSVVVYEARRETDEPGLGAAGPGGRRGRARPDGCGPSWRRTRQRHGLALTREPDLGFAWPIYRWARGESLAKVLGQRRRTPEMPAGDFVRWARQVVDLLGQLAQAPWRPAEMRSPGPGRDGRADTGRARLQPASAEFDHPARRSPDPASYVEVSLAQIRAPGRIARNRGAMVGRAEAHRAGRSLHVRDRHADLVVHAVRAAARCSAWSHGAGPRHDATAAPGPVAAARRVGDRRYRHLGHALHGHARLHRRPAGADPVRRRR